MPHRTVQRDAIHRVLDEADRPLTAKELLAEAGKYSRSIGIATVYREVKRMMNENQVRTVEIPGDAPRFEKKDTPHYCHMKCTTCGKVFNLEDNHENIMALLPDGFEHISHEVALYVTCNASEGEPKNCPHKNSTTF